jgi:hypothetical protein
MRSADLISKLLVTASVLLAFASGGCRTASSLAQADRTLNVSYALKLSDLISALPSVEDRNLNDRAGSPLDLGPYVKTACLLRDLSPQEMEDVLYTFAGFWEKLQESHPDSQGILTRIAVLQRIIYEHPERPAQDLGGPLQDLLPVGGAAWEVDGMRVSSDKSPVSLPIIWNGSQPELVGSPPSGFGSTGPEPDIVQQWRIAAGNFPMRDLSGLAECHEDLVLWMFDYLGERSLRGIPEPAGPKDLIFPK